MDRYRYGDNRPGNATVAYTSQTPLTEIEKTLPLRVLSPADWEHWKRWGYVIVNDAVPSFTDNESYAWCWARATFLDGHPRYRSVFRGLQKSVNDPHFNAAFRRAFAAAMPSISAS